jgi:hypothetical protein
LLRRAGGLGPGQIYLAAYNYVESKLKPEKNEFLVHMAVHCGASLTWAAGYPREVFNPVTADFFIAAYLALRVKEAVKPGRSAVDQLQFGIGFYFGAREETFPNAQAAISPHDKGKSVIAYQPVKDYLLRSDKAHDRDVAAYVQEVFDNR